MYSPPNHMMAMVTIMDRLDRGIQPKCFSFKQREYASLLRGFTMSADHAKIAEVSGCPSETTIHEILIPTVPTFQDPD
jgi:hypothetical protein